MFRLKRSIMRLSEGYRHLASLSEAASASDIKSLAKKYLDLYFKDKHLADNAMKRLSAETRADSKMKRSDFESALVHIFGAQKPGDWWYLPIDDTKAFALRRGVMNRLPFWQVLGIKGKTPIGWSQNLKDNFRSISMYENMKTIELLKDVMSLLKDGKQKEAEDQINSYDYEKML